MTVHPTPPLFDVFDSVLIINLPHRTDRRREMQAQLARIGMRDDPRVRFFPALSATDPGHFASKGAHGNFLSFQAALGEAANAGHSLLLLEDDCDFLLPEIFDYRLPDEWDVFYGGYDASDPDNPHDSEIVGAHFMGFSQLGTRIAADYFRRYFDADFVPDAKAAADPGYNPAVRPPTDGAFVWMRRAHPELVTVFAILGVQRSSRTDIGEQHWLDRLPVVREVAGLLRRVRNALNKPRTWTARRG